MTKKILLAGCSFTSDNGFSESNKEKYHWPNLLKKHYNFDITNVAVGGMPNDEIFNSIVGKINQNSFDLVIVLWTGINRKWIYFSDKNIDERTQINYGTQLCGPQSNSNEVKEYAKLHYAYFNNQYMEFKNWYLKIRSLEMLFQLSGQKYIFIRGFNDFDPIIFFRNISQIKFLFQLLNFHDENFKLASFKERFYCHEFSEDLILQKMGELKSLTDSINTVNWIEYESYSFLDSRIDLADDLAHPGPITNKMLAEKIIDRIDSRNLLQ